MQEQDRGSRRARLADVLEVRDSHRALLVRIGELEGEIQALRAEIAERSGEGWRRVPMSPEEFAARGVLQFLSSSPSAIGRSELYINGIGEAYCRYLDGIERISVSLERRRRAKAEAVAEAEAATA